MPLVSGYVDNHGKCSLMLSISLQLVKKGFCRSEDNFLWFLSCHITLALKSTSPDLQKAYSGGTQVNNSG